MNYLDVFQHAPVDLHTAMMFAAMMPMAAPRTRSGPKAKPREEAWRQYRATGKRYK